MSGRTVAQIAVKAAVPLLAAGIVGAVLIGSDQWGQGQVASGAHAPTAVPVTSAELVCPGPETIGVRGAKDPGTPPAPVRVSGATAPRAVRPAPAVLDSTGALALRAGGSTSMAEQTTGADLLARASASTSAAKSVVVTGTGAAAPGVVGEQRSIVSSGDQRGLTSATCLPAQDDTWLVGGGSDPGRRGRLVLSNPHESTTEVSVDVLSTQGQVARTTGSTVALAPHTRTVLLLDALAPGAQAPVVHVRSTGGSIGAVLSDAWLDGTTPRGTDDVVASPEPAQRVLVPGVRVDGAAALRIAVPGSAQAVAQIRMIGEKGVVDLAADGVLRVPAGSSRDVDLSGVPSGAYGIEVTADVPVVAGAVVQRRAGSGTGAGTGELAWSAAAAPLTSLAGLAQADVGPGWHTDLVLTAPAKDATVDVVAVADDGTTTPTTVQVSGGTTRVVAVTTRSVWLRPARGSGELVAARFVQHDDAAGPMITAGPLRQVTLTQVPVDVAPAAG